MTTPIGKARAKMLKAMGVETNKDLDRMSEEDYGELLKEAQGELLVRDAEYRQGYEPTVATQVALGLSLPAVTPVRPVRVVAPPIQAPDFAPYFNMSHPLPAERTLKGYSMDVPMEDYRAFPGVNASLLSHRTQCEMLHYLTKPKQEEKHSEATTIGTVLHWAALEPWKFTAKHRDDHMMLCKTSGLETETAKEQRKENPGVLLVTDKIIDAAHRCMEAIQLHDEAMEILNTHKNREVSGFVFDGVNEIWRKIRFDLFSPTSNIIPDVKTTRRHPADFFKDVMEFGYDKQAAWYLDTHTLLTGEFREKFSWIVISKQEPFMCRVFHMLNRTPDDPLYEDSRLKAARERLGLGPPSARIERLPMFIAAAKETLSTREMGGQLTPQVLRSIWSGYEYESPSPEIY